MPITREQPFIVDYISEPTDYRVNIENLKGEDYGINYNHVTSNIQVSVCAIIEYTNGLKDTITSTVNVKKGEVYSIDGSLIPDAFRRRSGYGVPSYIQFIIYPMGCRPMKWRVDVI